MSEHNARGTNIVMPQLAESVVTATVTKWLKRPGDHIVEYEPLCEIITDKVTAELPSTTEGVLLEIFVDEGATVDVGTVICRIGDATEAAQTGEQVEGESQSERAQTQALQTPSATMEREDGRNNMRNRYSPAVRTLADEHGIDLSQLVGSGLGGRITRKDVLKYLEDRKSAAQPEAVEQPSEENAQGAEKLVVRSSGLHLTPSPSPLLQDVDDDGRGEYMIDVTPIRHTIATRMRQSVSEIPHAWTMVEVDVTNLVKLRNKLKEDFKQREGINLTYLAFVMKAVVNAIKDYPIMNSVWAVDKIIVKRDINISLVVGTEESVLVPVIKKADQKNIAGLAREIDDITRKARTGKLSPADMQGGTFTVNNTGSFGSILSQPIINYPQAVNLTFEAIVKRPVVIDDMIAVRSMANMCLSLDHRIVDGVICGRFLQRVKENIEAYDLDTRLY